MFSADIDSYCTSGRVLEQNVHFLHHANLVQCQNPTNLQKFSREILRRWLKYPASFETSLFAKPLGRTLDPFLCIVSVGEPVVCYDPISPIRLASLVVGTNWR